ncbi:hypothetical protein [Pseudobdellovibrio exovorus]|nr:hypothetical protein [Pseudobdellovibrio exovorus]
MKSVLISILVTIAAINVKAANNFRMQESGEAYVFAQLNVSSIDKTLNQINPRFQSVTGANVKLSAKEILLVVNKAMPRCAPGMMCIQVMPAPLQIKLAIVDIQQTPCSVQYIARGTTQGLNEEIIVEDFSNSTCEMVLNSIGTVTYTAEGISSASQTLESATAVFSVQNEFMLPVMPKAIL